MKKTEKELTRQLYQEMQFKDDKAALKEGLNFKIKPIKSHFKFNTVLKLSSCLSVILIVCLFMINISISNNSHQKQVDSVISSIERKINVSKNPLTLSQILTENKNYLYEVLSPSQDYEYYVCKYANTERNISNGYPEKRKIWIAYNDNTFPKTIEEKDIFVVYGVKQFTIKQELKQGIIIDKNIMYYEEVIVQIKDNQCIAPKRSIEEHYLISSSNGIKDLKNYYLFNDFFAQSLSFELTFEIEVYNENECIKVYHGDDIPSLELKYYRQWSRALPSEQLANLKSYNISDDGTYAYYCYRDIIDLYKKK